MDDRLTRLLDLLDVDSGETAGTSVRLPVNLRDAATVAAEMGMAASTTELTVQGLRDAIEAFAQRAVLEEHYRRHPEVRPSLAEVALAGAQLEGNPLADRPDLIERAVAEASRIKPDLTPDEVLMYAAGLASAA